MPASPLAIGFWIAAYALGSISFAEIVARRAGIDIRAEGSGNPGATNVGRVLGKQKGRIVLWLDLTKAFVPALAARFCLGEAEAALTGFLAALGHCYPIWHRFEGGKGVATAAGALLALAPLAGMLSAITFFVVRKRSQRASVGSLAGASVGALASATLAAAADHGWPGPSWAVAAMALAILGLVVVRHRDNIARLRAGAEPPS